MAYIDSELSAYIELLECEISLLRLLLLQFCNARALCEEILI